LRDNVDVLIRSVPKSAGDPLLFKAVVNAATARNKENVPPSIMSPPGQVWSMNVSWVAITNTCFLVWLQKLSPSSKMALVSQIASSKSGQALVSNLFSVQDANQAPIDVDSLDEDEQVHGL